MIMLLQMDAAQQYNTNGRGYTRLLEWAKQHTEDLHAPPAGQEVVITSGSNHAIDVSLCKSATTLTVVKGYGHCRHGRCRDHYLHARRYIDKAGLRESLIESLETAVCRDQVFALILPYRLASCYSLVVC